MLALELLVPPRDEARLRGPRPELRSLLRVHHCAHVALLFEGRDRGVELVERLALARINVHQRLVLALQRPALALEQLDPPRQLLLPIAAPATLRQVPSFGRGELLQTLVAPPKLLEQRRNLVILHDHALLQQIVLVLELQQQVFPFHRASERAKRASERASVFV